MKRITHGFTLIELIITISAMILFFSISLGFYNRFAEQKKLDGDMHNFIEELELAKKKIYAGDKPSSDCELNSVSVTYAINPSSYGITAQCPDDVQIGQNQLLSNTDIFTTSGTVSFKQLGNIATYTSSCILIKNATLNVCRQISLESSGVITATNNNTCVCQ